MVVAVVCVVVVAVHSFVCTCVVYTLGSRVHIVFALYFFLPFIPLNKVSLKSLEEEKGAHKVYNLILTNYVVYLNDIQHFMYPYFL